MLVIDCQFSLEDIPQAAPARAFQYDCHVGSRQSQIERTLVRPIHDPSFTLDELSNLLTPLMLGCLLPSGAPKARVEVDWIEFEEVGQFESQGRFAGAARAEHEDSSSSQEFFGRVVQVHRSVAVAGGGVMASLLA